METLKTKLHIGIDPKTKMGGINYRLKAQYMMIGLRNRNSALPFTTYIIQYFVKRNYLLVSKPKNWPIFKLHRGITFEQSNGKIMQNKNIPPALSCSQ